MNGGVLEFAIGLQTNSFLERIGVAGEKLLGFIGLAEGVGGAFDQVWAQIEKGAQLKDLSARTGESVGNLYKLQEAFKAVGLGADEVSPMILRAQRSLSGVSETGESTLRYFEALHLNIQQLRNLDGASQIQKIAEALSHVDHNQASGAAAQLFGREGAGNILQIARAMKEFSDSMNTSGKGGALEGRIADQAKQLEHSATEIKSQIGLMWAGVAEGAMPAIEHVLDRLKGFDWIGIGEKIGGWADNFFHAFETGMLSDLIGQSMRAGIEQGGNYLMRFFAGLGPALQQMVTNSLTDNSSTKDFFKKMGLGFLGAGDLFAAPFSESASDKLAERMNQIDALGGGVPLFQGVADAFKKGAGQVGPLSNQEMDRLTNLLAWIGHSRGYSSMESWMDPGDEQNGKKILPGDDMPYHLDHTQLEKMGFVMTGIGNPALEHSRATAVNTGKTVVLLEKISTYYPATKTEMINLPY